MVQYFALFELTLLKVCFFLNSPAVIPCSFFYFFLVCFQSLSLIFFTESCELNPSFIATIFWGRIEELIIVSLTLYSFLAFAMLKTRLLPCLISYVGASSIFYLLAFGVSTYINNLIEPNIIVFIWLLLWIIAIKTHIIKTVFAINLSGSLLCVFFIEFLIRIGEQVIHVKEADPLLLLYRTFFIL